MTTTADTAITFTRVRPGVYEASTGHRIVRANSVSASGYTSIVWRIFFHGTQVREGTRLSDAKREVIAHVAQRAKGLA